MPTLWQNFTLVASPPCSPQIPTLRSGRVERPFSMAILTSIPTPLWIQTLERIGLEDALAAVFFAGNINRQEATGVVADRPRVI